MHIHVSWEANKRAVAEQSMVVETTRPLCTRVGVEELLRTQPTPMTILELGDDFSLLYRR